MKWALLSDIHANIQAMNACLTHARGQGAQRYALLGDLVGYGANPGAVVDQAMRLAEQGALLVKGNHDDMAVSPPESARTVGDSSAAWTHAQLDGSQRRFLDALPMTVQDGAMLLVHATADAPHRWRYVYDQQVATLSLDAACELPEVRHVFGGHVHFQTLYYRGASASLMKFVPTPGIPVPVPRHRLWLATVGSVGQPRDGNPHAMYAMMDTARSQLTFHRVAYDHAAAAAAILRTQLPAFFADRLELGR
ncbi:metallophosphoesterase family protein [Rhodoferax sp.]|uniref:metallophosphoesterase family protein n=1 Tax=Rhodoferax sp. TaxID=50421 RepID=UPI002761A2FB|nr:metallophosphoesterase family protein [Rhodoferax sp.]